MKTTGRKNPRSPEATGMAIRLASLLAFLLLLTGCSRATLRRVIDAIGRRDNSKPSVYYEHEGYSPGLKRSQVNEEFSRYHYYIAPDELSAPEPEPEIIFRQDYEDVTPQVSFDEEQYWRDHPLQLDGDEEVPEE